MTDISCAGSYGLSPTVPFPTPPNVTGKAANDSCRMWTSAINGGTTDVVPDSCSTDSWLQPGPALLIVATEGVYQHMKDLFISRSSCCFVTLSNKINIKKKLGSLVEIFHIT